MARFPRLRLGGPVPAPPGLTPPPRNVLLGCRLALIGGIIGVLLGFSVFLDSFIRGSDAIKGWSAAEVRAQGLVTMAVSAIALGLAFKVLGGSRWAARALPLYGLVIVALSALSLNLITLIGIVWIGASSYLVFTGAREWHAAPPA